MTQDKINLISQKKQGFPFGDSLTLILFQNTLFGSASFNNILNRRESKRPKNCWLTACFEEGEMPQRTTVPIRGSEESRSNKLFRRKI